MTVIVMRLKCVLICALSLYLFVLVQAATPASSNDRCALPLGLRDEISKQYPDMYIVRCPGLVKINFYGDGNPTWAFVLISRENPKRKAELVVARHIADKWETRSLETADGTPVVWSEGPGKYDGMSDPMTIRVKYPVIVFCGYESWAILYAWTGKEIEKTWISD